MLESAQLLWNTIRILEKSSRKNFLTYRTAIAKLVAVKKQTQIFRFFCISQNYFWSMTLTHACVWCITIQASLSSGWFSFLCQRGQSFFNFLIWRDMKKNQNEPPPPPPPPSQEVVALTAALTANTEQQILLTNYMGWAISYLSHESGSKSADCKLC